MNTCSVPFEPKSVKSFDCRPNFAEHTVGRVGTQAKCVRFFS